MRTRAAFRLRAQDFEAAEASRLETPTSFTTRLRCAAASRARPSSPAAILAARRRTSAASSRVSTPRKAVAISFFRSSVSARSPAAAAGAPEAPYTPPGALIGTAEDADDPPTSRERASE